MRSIQAFSKRIFQLLLIGIFLFFTVLAGLTVYEVAKDILFRSTVQQDATYEGFPVQVFVNLNGFFKNQNGEETFYFVVKKVNIYQESLLEPGASICLKKIHILTSIPDFTGTSWQSVEEFSNLCSTRNSQEQQSVEKVIGIPNESYTLFGVQLYPLDSRRQIITIVIDAEKKNGEALSVIPEIIVNSLITDWEKKVLISRAKVSVDGTDRVGSQININFQRPFSTRLLTAILFLTLLVFAVALIRARDLGSALQVAVAILLGLWGIQGILIPPSINRPNLVNVGVIALYVLMAWVTVTRFIWWPLFGLVKSSTLENNSSAPPSYGSSEIRAVEQLIQQPIQSTSTPVISQETQSTAPAPREKMVLALLSSLAILIGMIVVVANWKNRHKNSQ